MFSVFVFFVLCWRCRLFWYTRIIPYISFRFPNTYHTTRTCLLASIHAIIRVVCGINASMYPVYILQPHECVRCLIFDATIVLYFVRTKGCKIVLVFPATSPITSSKLYFQTCMFLLLLSAAAVHSLRGVCVCLGTEGGLAILVFRVGCACPAVYVMNHDDD